MTRSNAASPIRHVFVLMLENRSFDHMLGFSGIRGTDAASGQPTATDGLSGAESNSFNGTPYGVTHPADWALNVDPRHEFGDVVTQLCGPAAAYQNGGAYPPVNCGGFVTDWVGVAGTNSAGEIMKCYEPGQLPVLNALANEFVVCDHWHASMPGPTWPNRFFVHAASSGGLDHSPTVGEISTWDMIDGFKFANGTIFDRLRTLDPRNGWGIYAGGDFPNVAALKGINNFEINYFENFAGDVALPGYPWLYTFIEPNYGDVVFNTFRGGNSQHPLDDVRNGEALIKTVYEAIRKSPIWNSSLLIVTWDEHGGFYDHVPPPTAIAPGDQTVTSGASQFQFTFQQYGPRVPAIVISPLIPRNLIDHRLYDHASVPATIEAVFGLAPLTRRDAVANHLLSLATLSTPRTDAPMTLPAPDASAPAAAMPLLSPSAAGPMDSIDKGNLPGFLHTALRSDLALSNPADRPAILARFKAIKTRADAQQYLDAVRVKVHAARTKNKPPA